VQKQLIREMVLGLWKIHVLHHAAEEGVVGHHMLQELREHGYDVSPGTLYPILHRLEKSGLLSCVRGEAGSHAALRYDITPAGSEALVRLRDHVAELHRELSEHHEEARHTERGDRRKE
jgi:PadR family transcriptional regulator PadR